MIKTLFWYQNFQKVRYFNVGEIISKERIKANAYLYYPGNTEFWYIPKKFVFGIKKPENIPAGYKSQLRISFSHGDFFQCLKPVIHIDDPNQKEIYIEIYLRAKPTTFIFNFFDEGLYSNEGRLLMEAIPTEEFQKKYPNIKIDHSFA